MAKADLWLGGSQSILEMDPADAMEIYGVHLREPRQDDP